MNLYVHYKNKPYKYLGTAKHSETQEDLVIYETRYENSGGRLWVRPKKMFFESVEVNGKMIPRFNKIPLHIKSITAITENDINLISQIIQKTFGEWDSNWFYSTFNNRKKYHLVIAFIDEQAVGFKLGYENDQWEFYSWLGGVLPEYRGVGIASDLMKIQHEWCQSQNYTKIQTKTQNRFKEMLILNLKFGFEIIGTHKSDHGGIKIVLEKKLN